MVRIVIRDGEQEVPTWNVCRLHRGISRLDLCEGGVGSWVDNGRVFLCLATELVIDHVVNVVEPLAWIPSQGVLLDKLRGRLATEPAGEDIFHTVQDVVGVF